MYYPKSQIKSNLYTNGGEYVLSINGTIYKGYYYELSSGKKYTGKFPETNNILLLPINEENQLDINPPTPLSETTSQSFIKVDITIPEYNSPNKTTQRFIPSYSSTPPTTEETKQGVFTRYFCKKTNELKYIEINKNNYDLLIAKSNNIAWDLYEPTKIQWMLNGNKEQVYSFNKTQTISIENKFKWYGFSKYLKEDYTKYYIQ
jgi:hypothetical protein